MKHWYCSRVNIEHGYLRDVCDECEEIEKDGFKVEHIVYNDGQYQIFYSKK